MKIANLGNLTGPVLAWGGALGNLAALAALLRDATRQGLPAARVIATGDIAGMCGQSGACVQATRAFGGPVVAGDIERQLAAGAGDPGPGHGVAAGPWWAVADAQIGRAARDWMEELPDIAVFAHEGRRWAVIHGGLADPARALWPSTPDAAFAGEITAIEAAAGPVNGVIAGHTGLAFQREVGGVTWVNTGAVGMPPHDGRRAGRYARLDADGARILRLDYDPAPTFATMVSAGLTQGWDLALMQGRWPSEEMLPQEMRG